MGLTYTARFKSAKLAYADSQGTALSQVKKVSELGLLLAFSHHTGVQFGRDFDNLYDVEQNDGATTVIDDTVYRTKDFDNNGTFLRPGTGFVNGSLAIPAETIRGTTDTKSIGQNIVAYDPSSLLSNGAYLLERATDDTEWLVEEKVHNFYIQANINGDLGSVPVRGNIGLRYVDTSQSSTGTISGGLVNCRSR